MTTTQPLTHFDDPAPELLKTPDRLGLRAYLARARLTPLIVAVSILGAFLPVLIVSYAFSDDYMILSIADGQGANPYFGSNILDVASANGRPFQGLFLGPVFSAAGSIDNLRFVRLITIVGIVALGLLLHWALVRSRVGPTLAALVSILVCTLPAFQVYGSWAVLFTSPYAAILAGLASLFVVAAVNEPGRLTVDRIACAVVLLVAALLTYQPAAMFFWVFLAVALVGAVDDPRRAFNVIRAHFAVGIGSLALGYVGVKLGARYVGTTTDTYRNTLASNVGDKTRWFVKQPLYHSLNFSNLNSSVWLAVVVGALVAIGLPLLLWKQNARRPWLLLGAAIVLVPLCYLPNLVVKEDWASYRTEVSLSSLLALYACLGAVGLWLTVRDWLKPHLSGARLKGVEHVLVTISVAAVIASVLLATKNVTTLFAVPQNTELRAIRSQVAVVPTGVSRVGFVLTPGNGGLTNYVGYDEFGLASSSIQRVAQPAVWLVLREEGRFTPGLSPAVDVLPASTTTPPQGEPVVDVFPLLQALR